MSAAACATNASPFTSAAQAVTPVTPAAASAVSITRRPSSTRGHADHGWLYSYHTFSFANWHDPRYNSLHALRVINEDRVAGGEGFGRHPHRDFEIFSYVVSGALRHQDSLGNKESLKRGAVQFTTTGSGISHAEMNDSENEPVHFLQLWVSPNQRGLKPSYTTRHFSDAQKDGKLCTIVAPDQKDGGIHINQDVSVHASILKPGASVTFAVQPQRDVYVHLIQDATGLKTEANKTALTLTDAAGVSTKLNGGDGATVRHSTGAKGSEAQVLTLTGAGADGAVAEFLLFDIAKQS